jgi:hypothetical protein
LIFGKDDAVEIAADEVSDDNAGIDSKDLQCIGHPEVQRHTEVVECIGDTVGKSADNE